MEATAGQLEDSGIGVGPEAEISQLVVEMILRAFRLGANRTTILRKWGRRSKTRLLHLSYHCDTLSI